MISHGAHDDARLEPTTWLQIPQQAPPVDRNEATPGAALTDNPAVQANWLGGTIQLPPDVLALLNQLP